MASSISPIMDGDKPIGPREGLEAGPVPLYYQLEQRLRDRIHEGEFAKGDPLPTEGFICDEYGVSRITVRRALAGLQQQGLIERRRGVGSFVSDKPRGINSHLTGSLNEFLALAGSLTTRPISFEQKIPPKDIQQSFAIEEGGKAVLLTTVGSLEEGPTAYLEIWFRPEIGLLLSPDQLWGRVPVIRLVEQVANVQITRAQQTINSGRAGKLAGKHLGIEPDAPVLRVKRSYYAGSRLIEVANVVYHPERYSYAIEFKG